MKISQLTLTLLASLAIIPASEAADLKAAGQQLLNKGIESAVTGAVSGSGSKQVAQDTQQAVQEQAKQQATATTAEYAKSAPSADKNPLGALATGMAAQAAGEKAGQLVKGSNSAIAGQVANDLVKGVAGSIDQKLHGAPAKAAETAPAAVVSTPKPAEALPATAAKTTSKKSSKAKSKKKKH